MPRTTRERIALAIWTVLAIFVGNGIYDVMVARGVKEYLFRHALSEAGAGPPLALAPHMATTVRHATEVGLLWAALILIAGVVTVRLLRSTVAAAEEASRFLPPASRTEATAPPALRPDPSGERAAASGQRSP
jgi:hypothetical protein